MSRALGPIGKNHANYYRSPYLLPKLSAKAKDKPGYNSEGGADTVILGAKGTVAGGCGNRYRKESKETAYQASDGRMLNAPEFEASI